MATTHCNSNTRYITWDNMTGIQKIIVIAGSQKAVSDFCRVSQQAVSEWERQGYVPAERVAALAEHYGIERIELVNPRLRALFD